MTPDEAETFEASYKRASKVLKKINEFAERQANHVFIEMDKPEAFAIDNWQLMQAWWGGYRHAMRITQDLTRTK